MSYKTAIDIPDEVLARWFEQPPDKPIVLTRADLDALFMHLASALNTQTYVIGALVSCADYTADDIHVKELSSARDQINSSAAFLERLMLSVMSKAGGE